MSDNELIADFMGIERNQDGSFDGSNLPVEFEEIDGPQYDGGGYDPVGDFKSDKLRYDKSWDWLMPVVEKIESLGLEVQIFSNNCNIVTADEQQGSFNPDKNKIGNTYDTIVDYIKWYNQQSK